MTFRIGFSLNCSAAYVIGWESFLFDDDFVAFFVRLIERDLKWDEKRVSFKASRVVLAGNLPSKHED